MELRGKAETETVAKAEGSERNARVHDRGDETRRAVTPTIALAVIAVLFQAGILVIAPATSPLRVLVRTLGALDYAPQPYLALPLLNSNFVRAVLGGDQGATPTPSVHPPSPRPLAPTQTTTPSPSPTRSNSPLIPAAQQIRTFMRVSTTSAKAGDKIIYEVMAHNDAATNYTGEFLVETHTPLGTSRCTTTAGNESCSTPGDYDGSSTNSNDNHLNPQVQARVMTVNAHSDRILYSLVVQIAQATPSGTVLHNHAHVTVTGAGKGYVTSVAPNVVVQ